MSTPAASNEHEHHVLPLKVYFAVFAALLFLTVVTVGVSILALPAPYALILAMVVAFIKAALVVMFFMHLLYDEKFYTFAFIASLLFVVLFFGLTMLDLSSRGMVVPEQENGLVERYEGSTLTPAVPPAPAPATGGGDAANPASAPSADSKSTSAPATPSAP